jgi:zinc and cadmium transporter
MIVLHKPFDSLTLGTLMARDGWSARARHLVNGLFALAVPAGVLLLHLGGAQMTGPQGQHALKSAVLALSVGMFLCIALSDLLPELQFHQHDRLQLSAALVAGLAAALGVASLHLH